MVKIQTMICSALVLLGIVDLLTTLIGITGKCAVEANPLFVTLTQTNVLAFISVKILTVFLTSFMFLGASRIAKAPDTKFMGKYFMTSASIASCFYMTAVVTNNILVIIK